MDYCFKNKIPFFYIQSEAGNAVDRDAELVKVNAKLADAAQQYGFAEAFAQQMKITPLQWTRPLGT
jgi:hypothetical protein